MNARFHASTQTHATSADSFEFFVGSASDPTYRARAEARGITLNALVNQLLKKDIELIEAAR
jgi:hypothetical protein